MSVNILKQLRAEKELSQRQLAKLSGLTPTTIMKIEQGHKAEWLTTMRIAKALGIDPEKLESLVVDRSAVILNARKRKEENNETK